MLDYVATGVLPGWEYDHVVEEPKETMEFTNSFTTQVVYYILIS